MNVLHVTPAFYPATYWGGPIRSVYGLCNGLVRIPDVSLKVLTTDAAGPRSSDRVSVTGFPMIYQGAYEVFFCPRHWARDFSLSMLLRLIPMVKWADVIHLTAVYSAPTVPTLSLCRIFDKAVVWSPRGSLQRWDHAAKPLTKKAYELICRLVAVHKACTLHATSTLEAQESSVRIPDIPVAVVPNGVDIPPVLPARDWQPAGQLRLLYLGRLHPIKGIENLIRALTLVHDDTVTLSVYGRGNGSYVNDLSALVQELGLSKRIAFCGEVNGDDKFDAFMRADVCIVPSYSENFGMVIAEALAHAVPVIAGTGTPWADLEGHGCGLWVDNSPEVLSDAIRKIRTLPIRTMGERGRTWMRSEYGWKSVVQQMYELYQRQMNRCVIP